MGFLNDLQWNWEDMCGPTGLHPWNDTSKDFGLCFQQLFLEVPVFFISAIVSGFYIGYRSDWVLREKTQERAIVFRSLVVLSLAFIPVIKLYCLVTSSKYALYPIDYFTSGAACLSWLVHFGYVLALKHRLGASARGPLGLIVLWSTSAVLTAVVLRSRLAAGGPVSFDITAMVFHGLYLLSLIPSSQSRPTYYSPCLVGSQHSRSEYTPLLLHIDDDVLGTAMQSTSCYSKLTFTWVEPLFQKGLNNKLHDVEELFDLPAQCRCSYVGARLDRALIGNVDRHQRYEELPHEPFISSGYGSTGETSTVTSPVSPTSRRVLVRPTRRQNVTLLRALHSCFGVQFYAIGMLKFISDAAGFASPMLLNRLIVFVEDESIDLHVGYLCAAGLFFCALIGALFNAHFNWLMSLIGIKMKAALVANILQKVLSVSVTDLSKSFTVGEITNFMSTDTDRIVNSCPSFHALWSIPLQLFVTLFLMYQQIGLSFLAGVGFAILLLPVNRWVAQKIASLSTEMMRHKDERITRVSDMVRGIRTIKVHVWEDFFFNRIMEARQLEVGALRARKYLDAVCVVLWAVTPALLAALVLAVHAIYGGELRPSRVFTTVALVNMLIAPLNAFPWVLNGMAEAWVSVKRIQSLLELPEMDEDRYYDRLNKNQDEDSVIILKNATFSWSKAMPKKELVKDQENIGKTKKISTVNIQRRDSTLSNDDFNIQRRDSTSSNDDFNNQRRDSTSSNDDFEGKEESQASHDSVPAEPELEPEPFALRDISLRVRRGQLVGVVGAPGCGKSSLLLALAAHMQRGSGDVQVADHADGFGYVSQKPWLISGTIRDNILFGKPYDEAKFRSIIDACALTEDLGVLGWNARVGAGGCTLSGGQRARVGLARALYQDKQVYLVDDVLAALDARTAQHVAARALLGLMRRRTRVVVAPPASVLAQADLVLLLRDGRLVLQGPPSKVLHLIEEFLPSESQPVLEDTDDIKEDFTRSYDSDNVDNVSRTSLDEQENMSTGTIGWGVIWTYLKSAGRALSLCILLAVLLMQISQNCTFLWLSYWVSKRSGNNTNVADHALTDHENTTFMDHSFNAVDNAIHTIWNTSLNLINSLHDGTSNASYSTTTETVTYNNMEELSLSLSKEDWFYLEVYFGLVGVNILFTIMRAFLFAYGGIQAATKIHKSLLKVVIMAKVKFFDLTPTGQILNRFSSDTYTVDDSLPFILNILLAQFFSLVGALAVTVYGLPWLCVGLVPLIPIYHWLQKRYRIVSRHLKRLQSVTLSPIYSHFSDTLDGVTTVTSLRCAAHWHGAGGEAAERWQRAALSGAAASQWLALRLQALAVLVVGAAAALAVLQRQLHAADAALVGLAMSYALSVASTLSGVMNAFTETEREMIAVERVSEYILNVESEKIDGDPPPYGWPTQGVITFTDVTLKYSGRSEPALDGASWSGRPGEHVCVVGRSGAGKSSLAAALLRLEELAPGAGRVAVDGVDVARVHLHSLRARCGVLPQEPFVWGGSVRANADPLREHSAREVRAALRRAGADNLSLRARADKLSRGQRQLLCLARVLLRRAKIVIIDEATAQVDAQTERRILRAVRSLRGCSVLLVAHRPAAALAAARVLVLARGRVLASAAPAELLRDPASAFYALVHAPRE